ncbi:sigma 54-interacting transcriptional regulator [Clostridium aestuarii]|uniref:Sigma 54-interacting transcriptional regulator n=1 Tax=Clostridium aestuarii TaxID=338193 RepID=A0ABT4D402_9CLOT|nr:sigma 54-interacting transcriptional regulator [Clostridium aestuarii]MCY6484763.1 sigma 54-interacting transcriptional regulator [Clostridium aestuarii]
MNFVEEIFKAISENINEALVGIDNNEKIFVLNSQAEKLLGIKFKYSIGKDIKDIIFKSELPRVIKTKKKELNERFSVNGREFNVNRIPLMINGEIKGAFAIFQDMTLHNLMQERLCEDKVYIDILDTIINTANEWAVVIDENGKIIMMSKGYKEFIENPNPEGKHVTEVIENTRLHIVLKTAKMEVGEIQEIRGNKMVAMRIPIKKNNKVVGAVGKVMFKDIGDFFSLSKKLNNLQKEIEYYKSELIKEEKAKYSFNDIVGNSPETNKVKNMATRVANTDSNVLVLGESGTGKELYASAIHNASKRCLAPFIKLNCAAIPAELLESELFGYEEGAFTGAKKGGKKGKFELANGGTILLDEIGDMPMNMQVKLLRVIQEREVVKVGGHKVKKINVRIIASTNKNLEERVKNSEFREDLYYRLNVMKITIPPLRERKDDIPALANALRIKVANRLGIYVEGISKEAVQFLVNYDWSGNVRELENVIERAINLLDTDLTIKVEHLPERITKNKIKHYKGKNKYLKDVIDEVEKEVIQECLRKTKGNKNKTSRILGISRAGLYKKIEKYNLDAQYK